MSNNKKKIILLMLMEVFFSFASIISHSIRSRISIAIMGIIIAIVLLTRPILDVHGVSEEKTILTYLFSIFILLIAIGLIISKYKSIKKDMKQ